MENKFLGRVIGKSGNTLITIEKDNKGNIIKTISNVDINLEDCLYFIDTEENYEGIDIKEYIFSRIDNYLEVKETEDKQKEENKLVNFLAGLDDSVKKLNEQVAKLTKDIEEIKQDKKKQDEMITGENLQQLLNKRPELSSFVQCTNGIVYITKESVNNVATALKDVKKS